MAFERTIDVGGSVGGGGGLKLRFASQTGLAQDEEWFEAQLDGEWRRFRIHDYNEVYMVPGLYESLLQRALQCNSPLTVVSLLQETLDRSDEEELPPLRVLDVGAGNGMVGYELQDIGAECVVGVDIIPEAKISALRDRPWCYDDYHVVDLTAVPADVERQIRDQKLNCMTLVAALGFGDIPTAAFVKAIDLIETPGWLAFNIKQEFVQGRDSSGFAALLNELTRTDVLRMEAYVRYRHRFSTAGDPLHYIAMVATKLKPVPDHLRT